MCLLSCVYFQFFFSTKYLEGIKGKFTKLINLMCGFLFFLFVMRRSDLSLRIFNNFILQFYLANMRFGSRCYVLAKQFFFFVLFSYNTNNNINNDSKTAMFRCFLMNVIFIVVVVDPVGLVIPQN